MGRTFRRALEKTVVERMKFTSNRTSANAQQDKAAERLTGRERSTNNTAGWKPFWCRRFVIVGFTLSFAAMLATLEVIENVSRRRNGIAKTHMSWYYLWTYGPTAILTVVAALWNRVDYRIRQMTPWMNLFKGPGVSAQHSVVLDYISPSRPEIIWYSLRNGDWLVSISSAVGLFQTMLMVISTGLFSLTPVPKTIENVPYKTTLRFANDDGGLADLSALPAYTYDAIQTLNLSYPAGSTANVVYQQFKPLDPAMSSQAIQQANVNIMMRDLDCQTAELQVNWWTISWLISGCWSSDYTNGPYTNTTVNVTTDNCQIPANVKYTPGDNGDVGTFAVFKNIACNGGSDVNEKVVVLIGQAHQSGTVGSQPTTEGCNLTTSGAKMTVLKSKQWICTPNLVLTKGNVTFNSSAYSLSNVPDVSIDPFTPAESLSLDSFGGIDDTIFAQAEYAPFQGSTTPSERSMDVANSPSPSMLVAILRRDSNATLDNLLDTDLFLDLFKGFYKEMFVQVAHAGLTLSDDSLINGTAVINEDRLMTREVPLRSMQAIQSVLVVLTIICIVALPRQSVVPLDPASLAGLLSILKMNTPFAEIFAGTGFLKEAALAKAVESMAFASSLVSVPSRPGAEDKRKRFLLEQVPPKDRAQPGSHVFNEAMQPITWWRPVTICKRLKLPAFVQVALVIITLEVLLAESHRHQGLGNVRITGDEHLAWSWSSAAVMVAIALYFQALDGSYKMLLPYYQLSKGAPARSSMAANYLSSTNLEVLGLALRDRQPGVFFMVLSVILSTYLTIVVSGIFTPSFVPSNTKATLAQTSWFTTNGSTDDGTNGKNAIISGLILEGNLSYPSWTYGDLVLGSISLPQNPTENSSLQDGTALRATVPAIRSSLNCTIYDQTQIPGLTYYPQDKSGGDKWGIYANMPGLQECAGNSSDAVMVAGLLDMGVNANDTNHSFGGFVSGTRDGCPLLNFFWGYQGPYNNLATNVSVTWARALSCYETISQVDVNTTFSMPTFAIDEKNAPMADEKSSRLFSSANVAIPYANLIGDPGFSSNIGEFFYKAIAIKSKISHADLGDPNKIDVIVTAIKEAHRIIRAQQYNVVLRTNDTASAQPQKRDAPLTFTGTLINPSRYRLVQNKVSTHILSGLLAAMLLCASLASLLMSTKEVLPKNPCSIAVMTSLLADSNMLRPEHDSHQKGISDASGSRDQDDKSSSIFKMGWFEKVTNEGRAFTIHELREGRGASPSEAKALTALEPKQQPSLDRLFATKKSSSS